MGLGGWFSFDAPRVSFLFFVQPPSEGTAAFHTVCFSCQREAWGVSESPFPHPCHTGSWPSSELSTVITDLKL